MKWFYFSFSDGFMPSIQSPIRSSSGAIFFNRWALICSFGMNVQFEERKKTFCCSIYDFERLAQVPHKFKFPLFETFHWFAAKAFYEELKGKNHIILYLFFHKSVSLACNEPASTTINSITLHASESILVHMSQWLSTDKRVSEEKKFQS
jgi:hypothetical protein